MFNVSCRRLLISFRNLFATWAFEKVCKHQMLWCTSQDDPESKLFLVPIRSIKAKVGASVFLRTWFCLGFLFVFGLS